MYKLSIEHPILHIIQIMLYSYNHLSYKIIPSNIDSAYTYLSQPQQESLPPNPFKNSCIL